MSFSSAPIQQLLNDRFVCARVNIQGERTSGASFAHAPEDPPGPCLRGNGKQNIQVLFLTPKGEIFHVLTGYVEPEELQRELSFALDLFESLTNDREESRRIVQDAHERYLRRLGFTDDDLRQPSGGFPGAEFGNLFAGGPQGLADLIQGKQVPGIQNPEGLLASFSRQQVLSDHRFAIEHSLLPLRDFQPETLVGNGTSFFGSTGNGMPSGGRIGR